MLLFAGAGGLAVGSLLMIAQSVLFTIQHLKGS
jgi:hypothetical protein